MGRVALVRVGLVWLVGCWMLDVAWQARHGMDGGGRWRWGLRDHCAGFPGFLLFFSFAQSTFLALPTQRSEYARGGGVAAAV